MAARSASWRRSRRQNKLYALYAPEVECLAKGKAHTPYEFGVIVSITTTHKEGLLVGMRSMPSNPYDGHTLAEALEVAIADRDYKGVAVDGEKIYHPGSRRGITHGLRAMIRRRSAIEPAIGHIKTDTLGQWAFAHLDAIAEARRRFDERRAS